MQRFYYILKSQKRKAQKRKTGELFMGVKERILICRVVERMEMQAGYGKRLGLENKSTYRGMPVIRSGSGNRMDREKQG
jgi:hypothetical protein